MKATRGGLIAGNWKSVTMTQDKTKTWVESFSTLTLSDIQKPSLTLVLFPPMSAMGKLVDLLPEKTVHVGAQDIDPFEGEKVRVTGSHHPNLVLDLGATYVLIGHSERRTILGETDELIAKKLRLALTYKLKPILCVGENKTEYEIKQTKERIEKQLQVLGGLEQKEMESVVIAYEPVWAIGTGLTPTPEEANDVCGFIRQTSSVLHVIYGGSVTAKNALTFFSQPNIDGALPGGASENPEEFFGIARAAASLL
jgi:triosephosphate isomerase